MACVRDANVNIADMELQTTQKSEIRKLREPKDVLVTYIPFLVYILYYVKQGNYGCI